MSCTNGPVRIITFINKETSNKQPIGADIATPDEKGRTALMRAAWDGRLDTVKYLAEHGADINAAAKDGETAIMYAARNGHPEVVKYLAEHGADINAADNSGTTAIMYAAWNGHLDIVNYLVDKNANLKLKNNEGKTAEMIALERNNKDIADCLNPIIQYKKKMIEITNSPSENNHGPTLKPDIQNVLRTK